MQRLTALIALAATSIVPTAGRANDVSFRTDVMAVLSKAGCNAGTCHGNANGKGGFRLSLRGDDPAADYLTLTRGQNGRRVNLQAPDESLLLKKPLQEIAHQGGRRFDRSSPEYQILAAWIADGARDSGDDEPQVVELSVSPRRVVVDQDQTVSLSVTARFSNGETRDVTRMAVYEPSQPIVAVSPAGTVRSERAGEVTVGVRYLYRQQPVRIAFIPQRPDFVFEAPEPVNEIDRLVFAKLKSIQVNPSPVCDDVTFLRRAYFDLMGLPPDAAEAEQFLADTDPDKRARLIDELLQRPEFADFWALKWCDVLRVEEKTLDRKGVQGFHRWVRSHIAGGTPLDELARQVLTARGSTYQQPAANFYRALRDPTARSESVAQLFLGLRLQCAKCHSHPFDRWTQDDYYRWASVFAGIDYKILENRRRDRNDKHEFDGEQIVYLKPDARVKDPRNGKDAPQSLLGSGNLIPDQTDPLNELARWMTEDNVQQFATAQANRIWYHLLGRGIVDPIDDLRATNPPSNPELLDWITAEFIAGEFDLRHLIRTIMNSRVYQLSSEPNTTNAVDEINFARALPRRLSAEQLLDAISSAVGVPVRFNGYPADVRAAQLPGVRAVRARDESPSDGDRFLILFGKPKRLQTCECERSNEPTLAQTFQLVSGPMIDRLLATPDNHIGRLLAEQAPTEAAVKRLYLVTLSRVPTAQERRTAVDHIKRTDLRSGLEDIQWSLLNSHEFLLRR